MTVDKELEVKIGALILDPHNGTPIVVLKSLTTEQVLPIWVGSFEANAITSEIEKRGNTRPMTHDLLRNFIVSDGSTLERVVITELRENTFYGCLLIREASGNLVYMDSRPSDAIALAMRFDCPIFVRESLFLTSRQFADDEAEVSEEFGSESVGDGTTEGEEWPDLIG